MPHSLLAACKATAVGQLYGGRGHSSILTLNDARNSERVPKHVAFFDIMYLPLLDCSASVWLAGPVRVGVCSYGSLTLRLVV